MTEPPEQSTPLEPSLPPDGATTGAANGSPQIEAAEPAAPASSTLGRGLLGLWTLIVRLIILGFGISLGWMAGALVAQVLPSDNPEPPLQEVVQRWTSQTWRKVRQLPQWWRGNTMEDVALAPIVPGAAPEGGVAPVPSLALTPEEQQQVEQELSRLQADLEQLDGYLGDLEASLGQSAGGAIETRLYQLERLVNPPETSPAPPVSSSGAGDNATEVYPEPTFSLVTDSIVFPSALLFEPESSRLTPAGQQLLNTIVPDLLRYPAATLLVGSHAVSDNSPQVDRKLTFQQSMVVQRYLDQQLGETGAHWVTIGYGQTRPRVAGSSPDTQQRNQRIEIGIVP